MARAPSYEELLRHERARRAKRVIAQAGESLVPPGPTARTGWPALDAALGGGLPRGAIAEVFGPDRAGKSSFAAALCANAREQRGVAAYVDIDAGAPLARLSGVYYCRPGSAEQTIDIAEALLLSRSLDLLVIDSADGLLAKAEPSPRRAGQELAGMLRRLDAALRAGPTCLLFTRTSEPDETFLDQTEALAADWRSLAHRAAARIRIRPAPQGAACLVVKTRRAAPGREVRVAFARRGAS